ncbi:MAG: tetratricopeptide repeat protein [Myxococcota bacterium]|nr:tetratricopeptide repeat protein [Myxococcota bacterium]
MTSIPILSARSEIHSLVQQHLLRRNSKIHPHIERGTIRFALACAGVGLDHAAGEQAMAFCDESARGKFLEYWLFTDRRLCGCQGETRIDVRFGRVQSHTVESGWVARKLHAQLADGRRETWSPLDFWDPTVGFLEALLAIPADAREPPPRPLCAPSEGDPTGAQQAMQWLGVLDDRTQLMLRYVDAAFAAGAMPIETGRDFVTRVALLHRNLHFGRGMIGGRWVSPVSANDLSNLMVELFGNPISHSETPVRTLQLASKMRSNAVTKAALSSAVGLASMAILGVGWVSTAKAPPPRFEIMLADTGPFCSYRLRGPRGAGLERESPELLNQIDVQLLPLEDEVLMRRLAFGWSHKTPELLAIAPEEVDDRLRAVLGGARAHVKAFVSDQPAPAPSPAAPSPAGMAAARALQSVAQSVLSSSDPVSMRINEAARLMTSGDYEACAAAYHAIAESHPEERGTCWSQIGAALYFMGRYEEAIQWYEAALREGADASDMRDNIDEARAALAKR